MEGFWSSIIPYFTPSLLIFPALTLPIILCFWWETKRFRWVEHVSILLLGILLSIFGAINRWSNTKNTSGAPAPFTIEWLNPCDLPEAISAPVWESERQTGKYIRYHSILSYPLYIANDYIRTRFSSHHVEWSEEEQQDLNQLISLVVPPEQPQGNLLIILMESFESWLMDSYDAAGKPICAQLKNYIATHELLYTYDVETQILYGMSADGQLLVNTGLYPVKEGVTCIQYSHNVYPNLAHFYPHSAIVNPCKNVWNQRAISAAYGYQYLIEPEGEYMFEWNDSIVVDKVIDTFYRLPHPCCVMGITVSGHLPFDLHPDPVVVSDTMPSLIQHYLQTAHFTDRQLGRLLSWADTATIMQNATIAITGDHRIFHAWMNDEIRAYGLRANLPFGTNYAGCPLVLIGPYVQQKFVQQAQQVDIFPTILHAIGQDSYYWKGLGNNLLEDNVIPEDKANMRKHISNKLIISNYFSTVER